MQLLFLAMLVKVFEKRFGERSGKARVALNRKPRSPYSSSPIRLSIGVLPDALWSAPIYPSPAPVDRVTPGLDQ